MLDTTNLTPDYIPSFPPSITAPSLHDIEASKDAPPPLANLLSFFQLNCHVSKAVTLTTLESSGNFDFLIPQEPWVNPFDLAPLQHPSWRAYMAFKHSSSKWQERHKAIIYIKKTVPSRIFRLLPGGSQVLVGVEISPPSKLKSG